MKKIYQITFIFLIIMLLLASCENLKKIFTPSKKIKSSSAEYDRHYDEEYGFSIELPKDWHITHGSGDGKLKDYFSPVFNAISPSEGGKDKFRERIAVVVIDLEKIKKLGIKKKSKSGEDISKISETGFTRIEGVVVNWYISKSYTPEKEKIKLKQMGFSIRKDGKIFKIGWVGESKKLKDYHPVVWYVAHSLKIKEGSSD